MSYHPSAPPVNPEWYQPPVPQPQSQFISPQGSLRPDTDEKIKAFLNGYDFYVLIDCSSSMRYVVDANDEEAPSRWDETRESLQLIVQEATQLDPDGVDVCFFGTRTKWIENVESPDKVKQIFRQTKPRGATNLNDALKEVFERHLEKEKSKRKSIVLVLTDGVPDDPEKVGKSITSFATRKLSQSKMFEFRNSEGKTVYKTHEFGIRFFQVGDDEDAQDFLEHLDDNLPCRVKKKRLDIIDTGNIEELRSAAGVRKAFADAIWD